jgi:hypothetical protein
MEGKSALPADLSGGLTAAALDVETVNGSDTIPGVEEGIKGFG